MSHAIYIQIAPDDQDRLDAEASAWARENPVRDISGNRLTRYSGFAIFSDRDGDGFCRRTREDMIVVAARDPQDAVRCIKAVAAALEPDIGALIEVELYNIFSEVERPDTVLRGVVACSRDSQGILEAPVCLCPQWPGYQKQFSLPILMR